MAKLSHSGHTGELSREWRKEWPLVRDAAYFWFFGLRPCGLLPNAEISSSPEKIRRWAQMLNLVDQNGNVPGWIMKVAEDPHWLGAVHGELEQDNIFRLHLDPYPYRSPGLLIQKRRPATMDPISVLTPPARTPEPVISNPELERDLAARLHSRASELARAMYFSPTIGHYGESKSRMMRAFGDWLDVQLDWCRYLDQHEGSRHLETQQMAAFIRFQCQSQPIQAIVETPSYLDPKSHESAMRKMLRNVARRLRLKFRHDKRGRPSKKVERGKQ